MAEGHLFFSASVYTHNPNSNHYFFCNHYFDSFLAQISFTLFRTPYTWNYTVCVLCVRPFSVITMLLVRYIIFYFMNILQVIYLVSIYAHLEYFHLGIVINDVSVTFHFLKYNSSFI